MANYGLRLKNEKVSGTISDRQRFRQVVRDTIVRLLDPANLLRPAACFGQFAGPLPGRLLVGHVDHGESAQELPQNGVRSTYRRLKVGKIGKINEKKGVRDNFGPATGVVKLSLAPFFAHLSSLSAMAASPRQSRAISL